MTSKIIFDEFYMKMWVEFGNPGAISTEGMVRDML